MPTSEEPAVTAGGPRSSLGVGLSKEKKSTPGKKLVQARLPFKRLSSVPKENVEGVSDVKKVKPSQHASSQNRLQKLDTSIDSLENECQVNPEIGSPLLKTVNGKGPLDQFLTRRTVLPDPSAITIDLTEDSNSTHECSKEVNALKEASNRTVQQVQISLKPDQNDQSEVPMETDKPNLNTLAFTNSNSQDQTSYFSDVLSDGKGLTMSQENKSVIFQGKKAVVVLEDIMITKPALLGSREGSVVFKDNNEVVDSPDEVEPGSPISSPSEGSSPVAGRSPVTGNSPVAATTQESKNSTSPSSLTTPRRKIPLKTSKPSSEKKLKEQEEKKKKQQAEREERERLKEEAKNAKERAKEEAKKKKDEEKELKDKERREKKDREEQEKKEKKEKEEKEKAEKLRLKEEKRKEKQDALEAKLEEKRKKEEEKKAKEEEKRIKAGKSEITRFFQKPKTQNTPKTFASSCGKFAPFEIKKNMALAPLCRVDFDQAASDKLDELLQSQTLEVSYLKELKCRKPRTSGRTIVHHHSVPANSDVIVVENGETDDVPEMPDDPLSSDLLEDDPGTMDNVPERKTFGRMKLLQFSENYRPAYWGTWNKASTVIHPRKPWLKDEKLLDYEVDSDEEWEEEEPGESLSHSEGDDEEEAGDDEEDDDGFFVPHGYLSDDEGAAEEERTDPENQKVRQKLKAKEWDELVSEGKKFRVLKPLVIGCIWESTETSREMKALQRFAACILESVVAEEELAQEKSEKRKIKDLQILEKLLPLLHGNFNGSKVIIHEFQECCRRGLLSEGSEPGNPESTGTSPISPNTSRPPTPTTGENALVPSKARLKRIISENSTYEKRPDFRMCWYVHAEVLTRFDQQALPVPCQWTYLTQVNPAAKEDSHNSLTTLSTQTTPVSVKRKSSGSMSITKFMKRPKEVKQVGVVETDGFQADTEDEDDDEDCIVVDVQQNKGGIAAKTATLSAKTSPSRGSVVCVSNSTTLEVLEPECAMEVVPSEAPTANMNRVMKAGITGGGMVSNNREVKTVPHGDHMLCIDSAMDTIPSNDKISICSESQKTVSTGNAVLTMDTQLPCESRRETDVGVCLENTVPKISNASGIVDINSAMEPIPATSALISIPNQA